jgi:hypothetical protein
VTGFDQPDKYPWHILVEEYTKRSLSFAQDRAVAISGIAERIGNMTKDEYCAGLWRLCLVNQLGWYDDTNISYPFKVRKWGQLGSMSISAESHPGWVVFEWGGALSLPFNDDYRPSQLGKPTGRQAEDSPKELRAPSWSWLSTPNPVRFRVSGVCFTLDIVDVQIQPLVAGAPFGDVDFGKLTVRGLIKPAICSDGNYVGLPPDVPQDSTVDSCLWLKLGEDRSAGGDANQKIICLELRRKTEYTWVRAGLVATSDKGWLETKTIVII